MLMLLGYLSFLLKKDNPLPILRSSHLSTVFMFFMYLFTCLLEILNKYGWALLILSQIKALIMVFIGRIFTLILVSFDVFYDFITWPAGGSTGKVI